ncbi:MAG: 6-phosphogluconolactonase [Methylotenera sp.]|uniref:6-phosphogluconolactonase n=1 Tax=Methylotenera sp. TaxID=2051956 RepID=UPI00248758B2|nr:6-phosphogluconolactonase [Methylotenera sp.]MDI1307950.1 6-phosphogluconolactonase [Methylotenera sp.]
MQEKSIDRWQSFETMESLRQGVCDAIVKSANEAIAKRGQFSIILAGGNTPRAIYSVLRDLPMDWSKWHIYHGDERCLPIDHEDRNSLMANQVWLDHVDIPEQQVHHIPAELGPIEGAKAYAETLTGAPTFDLVLLGLGEDGHTASLFPNHEVDNSADAVPVFNSPKPPAERVTVSQNRLNNAHEVIFMVTGAGKQEAVDNWRKGVKIPATLISPTNGVDIYCYDVQVQ